MACLIFLLSSRLVDADIAFGGEIFFLLLDDARFLDADDDVRFLDARFLDP